MSKEKIKLTHLIFNYEEAQMCDDEVRKIKDIFEELNIPYQMATDHPEYGICLIWNCHNVPENVHNDLPAFLKELQQTPERLVDVMITKQQLERIQNYDPEIQQN